MARNHDIGKGLLVILRRPPLISRKGAEGLRMAVGQSMTNRVTVVLVDAGVWVAGPLKPELVAGGEAGKHLGMLLRLKQRVWVEAESVARHGLDVQLLHEGVEVVARERIDRELLAADAVVVY